MLRECGPPDYPRLIHLFFKQLSQFFFDNLKCLEICVPFLYEPLVLVHIVLYHKGGSDAQGLVRLLEIEDLRGQFESGEPLVESIQELLIVVSSLLVEIITVIFSHSTCVAVRAEHFELERGESVSINCW